MHKRKIKGQLLEGDEEITFLGDFGESSTSNSVGQITDSVHESEVEVEPSMEDWCVCF